MSSPTSPRTPTSFFSLARELRDQIYHELLLSTPPITTTLSNRIHLHATSTPLPHLLLINKQFSHEYLSLSLKLSTLKISNHISSTAFSDLAPHRIFSASEILYIEPGTTASTLSYKLALQPLPTLPPAALRIRNLNFDIICSRFRAPTDELSVLETWTDGILSQFSLKELKSLEFDIVVQEASGGMGVWELESEILWSGNWVFLKGLKGLRVWRDGRVGELGNGIRVRNSRRKRVKVLDWDSERRRFGRCEGDGVGRLGVHGGNIWLNTAM
ncbi:hypothetical protein CERZMDRAFT_92555 [Cercospora zeae-maydis SCOH1-5]|uniref:Uncharacterized protein n=1 Tax=Cercospora zeae-maydis SCOH1-5 TaxID=717836 RepID=A0A6A6FWR2_9PEZI|nr:hypothetical protein CERZMDRAFT_92555 [Cercospora zeae-maydis SCOH1-5]